MKTTTRPVEKLKQLMAEGPLIMGILNVTPDSFSDGGQHNGTQIAIARAAAMIEEGAHIIDIGGESTRPGAQPVSMEEEIRRTAPVISALKGLGALLSIDTRNAGTMQAALNAGANIINDVSALTHDPHSIEVAAAADVPVCLMHMLGTPQTMQSTPEYGDVVEEVLTYLAQRAAICITAGIQKDNIILDPGIGFGKQTAHNLELLKSLHRFTQTGFPILLGASRKSFIEKICGDHSAPTQRLGGSIATVIKGCESGVKIFRVHDVHETVQALKLWNEMKTGEKI